MKNLIFLIHILCLFVSCGYYSFSGSSLPSHLKTIAVRTFENRTSEMSVDTEITNRLTDKFTKDNSLIVEDIRKADSILEGVILSIQDDAADYTKQEQVKDYKLTITVNVKFKDIKKNKVIWEENLTKWAIFDPAKIDGRKEGINQTIDYLTEDIFNRTIAGW